MARRMVLQRELQSREGIYLVLVEKVRGRRQGGIDEVQILLGTCTAYCMNINSVGTLTRQSAVVVYNAVCNYLCAESRNRIPTTSSINSHSFLWS